jgi:cystathionine gamma-synthase
MRIETLAVHAGRGIDPATGAVATPIHLSTTFAREADGSVPHGYVYSRFANPNRDALEQCLAALEGGAAAAAFASGSAATVAILQALAPGSHVIAPVDAYHGTTKILREILGPWGLLTTFVDMTDPAAAERAIRPGTKLIWMETPSNPLLRVTDIAAISTIARRAGLISVCDNTWATPALQRPLDLGADLSLHATTKYLSGQHDVMGGAVVARRDDDFFQKIRNLQAAGGAVPSPFECWLVLRGVSTLFCRMAVHCENAAKVAEFLNRHPAVEAVHYPGLRDHPGNDIVVRQMQRPGGMLSFQVRGGKEQAIAVAGKMKLFTRATSLGGPQSLIEHRCSVEPPDSRTPPNLLRISVGLEHPDDLIADLEQALA